MKRCQARHRRCSQATSGRSCSVALYLLRLTRILSTVEPGPQGWLLAALGSLLPLLVGQALKAREARRLLSGGAGLVEPSG